MLSFLEPFSFVSILICVAIGFAYAYFLYQKKDIWSESTRKILFASRWILVSILVFLLLAPLLRFLTNTTHPPTLSLIIDNSESVGIHTSIKNAQWKEQINQLVQTLESSNIQVNLFDLKQKVENLDSIKFNTSPTNLYQSIAQSKDQVQTPLSGVILLSDGIYNEGANPTYLPSTIPLFTIGIGDTMDKKDIKINSVQYNKTAYKGNQFPVVVDIQQKGFLQKKTKVTIQENGKKLAEQDIIFTKETTSVEFNLSSETAGHKQYQIICAPLAEENTPQNNQRNIVVEILDNKQHIVIIANAPHPDMKAIQSALQKKDNIAVTWYVPGITQLSKDPADLYIIHHIPSLQTTPNPELQKILQSETPKWFILGNNTNIGAFNQSNPLLTIQQKSYQYDQVFPVINPDFRRFNLPSSIQELLDNVPPIACPFGDYKSKTESVVILKQRVGKTPTEKPLLIASTDRKSMVLCGEGIWQWRLQEQAMNQNTTQFDNFIEKIIQFVALQPDHRKFKVTPTQASFFEYENPAFEIEVYNDLMERINGDDIEFTVYNAQKKFTYKMNSSYSNPVSTIQSLPVGTYKFTASITLNNKKEVSSGTFFIEKNTIELLNTKADFNLLRTLAVQSNGSFETIDKTDELAKKILSYNFKSTIESKETTSEIIHLPWLFFVLITLAGLEWFIRKKSGGY
jgi:hypothetical protein